MSQAVEVAVVPFSMPRPPIGASVRYYVHGTKEDSPQIAFVLKVGAHAVVLQLASGMVRETVRHVGDPKLTDNVHQRENGAWDFTEDAYAVRALKARMGDLEADVQYLKDALKNHVSTDHSSACEAVDEAKAEVKVHWKTKEKLEKQRLQAAAETPF